MTDIFFKQAHNDNYNRDTRSDYIERLRQEWRDLELAAEDIWESPDKKPKQ